MNANDKTIRLQGSLWMTVDGQKFGGADRIILLNLRGKRTPPSCHALV